MPKRRVPIRIQTRKGPSHVELVQAFGKLCVHKDIEYPRLYTITHIPTGLAIRKQLSKFVAIRAAELMNTYATSLWDFTGTVNECSSCRSLKEITQACMEQATKEQRLTSNFTFESPQKDLFPNA